MKKVALLLLSALTLPALARPEPFFEGIIVGAAFGGTIAQFQVDQTNTVAFEGIPPPYYLANEPFGTNIYANSPAGLLSVGYNYQFDNNLLLGAVFTGGYTNANFTDEVNHANNYINSTFEYLVSTSGRVTNDFALMIKPGYVFKRNTLFYGLMGARWGNIKTSASSEYQITDHGTGDVLDLTVSGSTSEYKMGFTMGLGIQQLLAPRYSWALEYAYTIYGNVNPPNLATSEGSFLGYTLDLDNETKMKVWTNTLMFTLAYRIWE